MTNIKAHICFAPDFVLNDIFECFYDICDDTPNIVDENITFNVTRFETELENEMHEHRY
jgi:hypothetical protein